ncbi:MAG: hypothetical protein HQ567_06585 [Candidatus Nealsonbacteria bacterium]|nr:hypothetical protein [Candidatus Nealsonbacteria bacterium]
MVRIRRTSKPRNYLSRREQWRILLLVMSLGLVFYMMTEARDPDNLRGIMAMLGLSGDSHAADQPGQTRIDNLYEPPAEPKIRDTFISLPDELPDTEEEPAGRYFPGVDPKLFRTIRDDTRFRKQEQESWFNMLKVLKETDQETLDKASTGPVAFVQLQQQSNEYRGELVTVSGTVRRACPTGAARNDLGIERLWQVWLWPDDVSPIVIYCLDLPEGFPTGMEVVADVEITGFFFKRCVYSGKDKKVRTSPAVLARTVNWQPPPPRGNESSGPDFTGVLWIMAGALVVSIFAAIFVFCRTRPGHAEEEGAEPPNFDALNEVDTESNQ